jgi:uncharacterized Zn-binding protein involved in type VI secretion
MVKPILPIFTCLAAGALLVGCGSKSARNSEAGPGPQTDGGSVGSDGSPAPGDGGGDAAPPPLPDCALSLTSSGNLNIDIPTVAISGKVTLDGKALPAGGSGPRLHLKLAGSTSAEQEGGALVDLDDARASGGSYAVRVIPGTYDIRYSYTSCSQDAFPCQQGHTVKSGVALKTDGVLDIDLRTIAISGETRIDGNSLPGVWGAAKMQLRSSSGDDGSTGTLIRKSEGVGGKDRYQTRLFAGSYDLIYHGDSGNGACPDSVLPCQQGTLFKASLALKSDGIYDVELKTVRVTGTVTLDGSKLPGGGYGSGPTLMLRGTDGTTGTLARLGKGSTYAARVLPGSYDVVYHTSPGASCADAFPCPSGVVLKRNVALTQDGVLDLDLKTIKVTGKITLDQGKLPAASSYPELYLSDGAGAEGRVASLKQAQQAGGGYEARLFAGVYDLLYRAGGCSDSSGPYPCQQDVALKAGLSLSQSGVLDVDLVTVTVTGEVTLDGKPPPASPTSPTITLRSGRSSGTLARLDQGGGYTAHLFPGSYAVLYHGHAGAQCDRNPYPCQQGVVIREAVKLQSPGVLDLDLKTIKVTGKVTLDGKPYPGVPGSRVTIRGDADSTALPQLIDLSQLQAGAFESHLFAGRYIFIHDSSDACTGKQVPCQRRVLLQCGGL